MASRVLVLGYPGPFLQVGLGRGQQEEEVNSSKQWIPALNGALFNWNYLEMMYPWKPQVDILKVKNKS